MFDTCRPSIKENAPRRASSSALGLLSLKFARDKQSALRVIFCLLGSSLASASVTPTGSTYPTTGEAFWNSGGDSGTDMYIGYDDLGEVTIDGGSSLASNHTYLGYQSAAIGKLNVQGEDSSWTGAGFTSIGYDGVGVLNISGGATVSTSTSNIGYVGTGTVTIKDADSVWATTGNLTVGEYEDGILFVEAGAGASASNVTIGVNNGSEGFVSVDGLGAEFKAWNSLYVGSEGAGILTVTSGASLTTNIGVLGYSSGSTGVILVKDSGSTWTSTDDIYLGNEGEGTLVVTNGGSVNTGGDVIISANGTLNLGVSQGHTLVTAEGIDNAGTINLFSLGNLGAGVYLPLSLDEPIDNTGTIRAYGGTWNGSALNVSAPTAYLTALTSTALSGMRYVVDDGALVVALADDAGTGDLSVTATSGPAGDFDYSAAYIVSLSSTGEETVLLSFRTVSVNEESELTFWTYDGEAWIETPDQVFDSYEEGYYNLLVSGNGTYAVTEVLVPEPADIALGAGLLGLACSVWLRRRSRRTA
ncbi:hypothetical protein H5P28_06650 [Ruficoccus amylovorans]|uniref:PEP-CTERM sorting domain-containing protein n=1 Tax=Ruficoccus amylovorans TaxID=1804625 RepID=A0A842HCZ7_9BACT|nr:hypothetical protein [Ruficoccus amylovorans]MBC2593938.1 hypothetical protein [Ruficoccus amylovorans]